MEEATCIIVRQKAVFLDVMAGKFFPLGQVSIAFIVWKFIEDDKYLKVRAVGCSDIGGLSKHVLKVVVRVLRIVLHHKLDGNAGNIFSCGFVSDGYVYHFVHVAAFDAGFLVIAIALRLDNIFVAKPVGYVLCYCAMKWFQLCRTS